MDSNSLSINVLLFLLLYSVVVFIVTWLWFGERKQGLLAFFFTYSSCLSGGMVWGDGQSVRRWPLINSKKRNNHDGSSRIPKRYG